MASPLQDPVLIRTLRGHGAAVTGVAFKADGAGLEVKVKVLAVELTDLMLQGTSLLYKGDIPEKFHSALQQGILLWIYKL